MKKKKNRRKMDRSSFGFSKYLNKKIQITKPYTNKYASFDSGEVIYIRSYELLGDNRDIGVLVTSDGRVVLEKDIDFYAVPYNPYNPALPVKNTNNNELSDEVANPYKKYDKQPQKFKFDDNDVSESTKQISTQQPQQVNMQPKVAVSNNTERKTIFDAFQTESNNFTLKLQLKLPKLSLLKSMYNSSADVDVFLNDLSYYVNKQIAEDNIKDALFAILNKGKK